MYAPVVLPADSRKFLMAAGVPWGKMSMVSHGKQSGGEADDEVDFLLVCCPPVADLFGGVALEQFRIRYYSMSM